VFICLLCVMTMYLSGITPLLHNTGHWRQCTPRPSLLLVSNNETSLYMTNIKQRSALSGNHTHTTTLRWLSQSPPIYIYIIYYIYIGGDIGILKVLAALRRCKSTSSINTRRSLRWCKNYRTEACVQTSDDEIGVPFIPEPLWWVRVWNWISEE
jgi:hypothetical protein